MKVEIIKRFDGKVLIKEVRDDNIKYNTGRPKIRNSLEEYIAELL